MGATSAREASTWTSHRGASTSSSSASSRPDTRRVLCPYAVLLRRGGGCVGLGIIAVGCGTGWGLVPPRARNDLRPLWVTLVPPRHDLQPAPGGHVVP